MKKSKFYTSSLKRSAALTAIALICSCGLSQKESDLNIIGGKLVKKEDPLVKSVVMLLIHKKNKPSPMDYFGSFFGAPSQPKTSEGLCTGTVVKNPKDDSKWHVVTAAHCVTGEVTGIDIYKGSQAFGSRPNPQTTADLSKRSDLEQAVGFGKGKKKKKKRPEIQDKPKQEKAKAVTMEDLGFQKVGESLNYHVHADFNDLKMSLSNRVATLEGKLERVANAAKMMESNLKFETSLLSDLEDETTEFYDSLSRPGKYSYQRLLSYVNEDADILKKMIDQTKAKIKRIQNQKEQMEAALERTQTQAEEAVDHPGNDIAVININSAMPAALEPIKLADTKIEPEQNATLLGYGISYLLLDRERWVHPSRPTAIQTLRDLKFIELPLSEVNLNAKEAIFQGAEGEEAGLCSGDSGGPALIKVDDSYRLAGVNSQANCRNYSKITVVSEFSDWLVEKMQIDREAE